LLSAWRWWLPPAAVSLILILAFVDPFVGDWDALDYTVNALRGYPSSMALGRSLFIFYNHALYILAHTFFGLSPERAYLVFKYAVVAQAPLAVVACWTLARDLTHSHRAATVAALLVVSSPVFVLYSGQVMTDVPALLLLTVALIIHLRGLQQQRFWLVLVGAALLGAGVNLRETMVFMFPGWCLRRLFAAGRAAADCGWSFFRACCFWSLQARFSLTGFSSIRVIARLGTAGENQCARNRRFIRFPSASSCPG